MPSSKSREILLVGLLVALGAAMRLALFNGLYGHDDWTYLYYVRSFLNGQTDELLHTTAGLRFLLWMPMAGLFKLFGPTYYGAFLPGFLCGLATIPLTYGCIRKLGGTIAVATAGALILLFNPIDWFVSTTVRGDIEMSFFAGLLLLLLLFFREMKGRPRLAVGLAAGGVWGLSILTKEWGFVFAWGLFTVALFDLVRDRRIPWEYAAIGAGFLVVLGLDLLLLHALTGDWLARFHTSVGWYQQLANQPKAEGDHSGELSYLPNLLLGVRNRVTESSRFANGYPYLGIYMWLLLGALPLGLALRGPARSTAWFTTGILLWIEFGSMSWSTYLPFHKEPRYLAIISVPIAVVIALVAARLWSTRWRLLQAGLAGTAAVVALVTTEVVRDEHWEYTHGRDYLPALVDWLEQHPQARIWIGGSVQNEIDLRFGYRFSDPIHHHAGAPGYGSAMDLGFWRDSREVGDYVVVGRSWVPFRTSYPAIRLGQLESTPMTILRGPTSSALIYRVKPVPIAPPRSQYLSDWDPDALDESFVGVHFDCNVSGLPIKLGGQYYAKGLGTHANCRLTYRLNKEFSLFTSMIGVDDSEAGGGSVTFEVRLDNRLVYKSGLMHSGSPPENIQIDVKDAMTLQLSVLDAGDGIDGDHGNWAGAKLLEMR